MTQEEKQLLLKDLCARQFYGTKVLGPWEKDGPCELSAIDLTSSRQIRVFEDWFKIEEVKPYLRPMSSMTEKERKELAKILNYEFYVDEDFALVAEDDRHRIRIDLIEKHIDWLIEHHFDYRGLIPMGLALEASEEMYK